MQQLHSKLRLLLCQNLTLHIHNILCLHMGLLVHMSFEIRICLQTYTFCLDRHILKEVHYLNFYNIASIQYNLLSLENLSMADHHQHHESFSSFLNFHVLSYRDMSSLLFLPTTSCYHFGMLKVMVQNLRL